ncbi:ADP-L-glycero-D-manno-heptose 6-epimerase [Rhodoblastus acidophilus]|uniref:ADP-glyceromanno-heptose 6-epimerase n=1 Tax=Rhodoblastus acidophilus TaxID=1074 RepID=UPI0022254955|nr:ADP-glyceromanno-heptose 6-epimerase [Rhodoblastus acidophilus]MCW2316373.1 ADP-L-glycero-D-manno-heptose 6-epimerase [Rhodoblastus acidophilus]
MLLLTGAAGFIGSNLLADLNENGVTNIAICDDLGSEGKWLNLRGREFAEFIPIAELPAWLETGKPVSGVVHLGANSSTTATDGDEIMRLNFNASLSLWNFCARRRIPFVYASSAATYGDGAQGFLDADDSDHLAKLTPLNLYGWSKHVFDRRIARTIERGEAAPPRWYGVKFFNVYGPNEHHKAHMRSPVYNITKAIESGAPARLFASDRPDIPDGGQSRDFVHVNDVCAIMLWLLRGTAPSGLYNAGTGGARSFADMARAVYAALGVAPNIEFIPMPDQLKGRYQYWTEADLGKLRGAGYNGAPTSLEDGVRDYVVSYLAGDALRFR